jgi:hypothetical protein
VTEAEQAIAQEPGAAGEDPAAVPERKSAIVTAYRRARFGPVEDITPEELLRRADAADAIMQGFKRKLAKQRRK